MVVYRNSPALISLTASLILRCLAIGLPTVGSKGFVTNGKKKKDSISILTLLNETDTKES